MATAAAPPAGWVVAGVRATLSVDDPAPSANGGGWVATIPRGDLAVTRGRGDRVSGVRQRVLQVQADGRATWRADELSGEEPLEIRVNGRPFSVTMRTPGADFDLAVGFLVTEGVIDAADNVTAMRLCPAADAGESLNVVEVTLREQTLRTPERAFYTTSSCGICGKASIEAVRTESRFDVADDPLHVTPALLAMLPERLRAAQKVFARTGGLHAAALFDATGTIRCVREDVGRHNAFDKVIGWAATRRRLPLRSHIILASGRASFELTQKALMAGIPMIAAVSAPSQLAVELAAASGMTLVGFLRGKQMNVYTGHARIDRGISQRSAQRRASRRSPPPPAEYSRP